MLSHRVNVRTSKFWRKSKETKRNFFSKIYQGHIRIWFRSKKYSKISHACVPLRGGCYFWIEHFFTCLSPVVSLFHWMPSHLLYTCWVPVQKVEKFTNWKTCHISHIFFCLRMNVSQLYNSFERSTKFNVFCYPRWLVGRENV